MTAQGNRVLHIVLVTALALAGCDSKESSSVTQDTGLAIGQAEYVGSGQCADCHAKAWQQWQGSHHQLAMAEPTEATVLGDFADAELLHGKHRSLFKTADRAFIVATTDGAEGPPDLNQLQVRYTFGVAPLQQYLVDVGGGRLQALPMVWDSRTTPVPSDSVPHQGGWYHLNPSADAVDNPEHWRRGGQNWNHMCADCHSTAVRKNYSPATDTFATEFAEVSVGCEACHGPGSLHAQQPTQVSLPTLKEAGQQLNTCATCHSRRTQLAEGFTPQHNYLDHYLPALLDDGLYHSDGQILDEVYVYGSFVQSKMHRAGVACSNCHEAHSAQLKITGNGVCTQCHNVKGRADFPSLRPADYDTAEHHFHDENTQAAACVSCHMPERVYMGIDGRRDHSFRKPRPDLSARTQAPNPCTDCHQEKSAQWAADIVSAHYGTVRTPETEHFGVVFAQARDGQLRAESALAVIAADSEESDIVRATALSLLAGYQRQISAEAIAAGLNSASALQRIGAVRGAARWSFAERWRRLRRLLQDPILAVRIEATQALLEGMRQLPVNERGLLSTAVDEYLVVQQLHLDRPGGRTNLANAYLQMGDLAQAQEQLQQALVLNPDWVPGMVNLADLYRAQGRDAEAGPLLQQALLRVPDSADVLVARAMWLVRQGQREAAVGLLAQAYAQQPNQRTAYLYAVALHSTGNSAMAFGVIEAVMASGRRFEQMLSLGASIAQEIGDAERLDRYRRGVASPL